MSDMIFLYQVVFCSSRVGRIFRREIAVSQAAAMVTKAETMPPGYQVILHKMREENERILYVEGKLKMAAGYDGCPFCNNMTVFYCTCGALSCISSDPVKVHCCPVCKDVSSVRSVSGALMSRSGFVHGGGPSLPRNDPPQSVPQWPPANPYQESSGPSGNGLRPENDISRLLRGEYPSSSLPPIGDQRRLPSNTPRALPSGNPRALPPGSNKALPPGGGPPALPPGGDEPSSGPPKGNAARNLQEFLKKRKKK